MIFLVLRAAAAGTPIGYRNMSQRHVVIGIETCHGDLVIVVETCHSDLVIVVETCHSDF